MELNNKSGMGYLGRPYKNGHSKLSVGDNVWVHPVVGKSKSTTKYKAIIIIGNMGLSTTVVGKHESAMNDYLFNRLEKID